MAKKLLVFLTILVVCVAVFVACGEPATTTDNTTTPKSETTTTKPITTEEDTTEEPPVSTTPFDPSTLDPKELHRYETDAIWCGPIHAGVVYNERSDKDNSSVKHMAFRFGYGSDNGIFGDDPDYNVPAIQLTKPDCVYIMPCDEFGTSEGEYTKYEVEYYETPNWWEVWFVPKGFTPVDGQSYAITLFIESDDSLGHIYPNTTLFWETWPEEPWTYEAPAEVVSKYGNISEFVPGINDRTQLYYHDTLSVDADGKVKYTIKSDNNPFADVGDNKGISYTRFGKLIINGQEVQIVADSYYTEQHYIIYFTIAGYTFVEGETYEMIFTIEANDQTGDYCKNLNGYFALNDYTHVAG